MLLPCAYVRAERLVHALIPTTAAQRKAIALMHRIAHYVSGGLIVALPGPDEDHNPETRASLQAVLGGRADIPMERRLAVSRMIEDLTVSHQSGWYSAISLHGGGSPEAMKREIWRNYPVPEKVALVEDLLERGVLGAGRSTARQPGRCCDSGCTAPETGGALPAAAEWHGLRLNGSVPSRPRDTVRGRTLRACLTENAGFQRAFAL